MTTDEAGLLIATLAAAYPRQELTPATVEVYTRSLTDLNHDLATAAVASLIASSTFFPAIAEIRGAAAELATNLPGPAEAWTLALHHALNRDGPRPELPAEVHAAINAIGGTWEIRMSTNTEALRAQFRRAYEETRKRTLDTVVLAGVPALNPPPDGPRELEAVAARNGERGAA